MPTLAFRSRRSGSSGTTRRSLSRKVNYRSVAISGNIYIGDQLKRLVKVGSVLYERDNCKGSPVAAYVQRNGSPQGLASPLANDGYTLGVATNAFHQ